MNTTAWIGLETVSLIALAIMAFVLWRLAVQHGTLRQRLEQSDEMLSHAGELGQVGIWSLDLQSDRMYWSDRVFEIHGRPLDKGEPDAVENFSLYHREDVPKLRRAIERAVETGMPFEFSGRVIAESGETKSIVIKAKTGRGESGKVTKLYGVVMESAHVLQLANSVNDNITQVPDDRQA